MSTSHPKTYLKGGVARQDRPTPKGRSMPKITHTNPPEEKKGFIKKAMLEMAKAMAKEMAQEISKNLPQQQIVVSNAGVPQPVDSDIIELESGFIDPTESENYSVNLDNIESTKGESIKEKMKKLKEIKGES